MAFVVGMMGWERKMRAVLMNRSRPDDGLGEWILGFLILMMNGEKCEVQRSSTTWSDCYVNLYVKRAISFMTLLLSFS